MSYQFASDLSVHFFPATHFCCFKLFSISLRNLIPYCLNFSTGKTSLQTDKNRLLFHDVSGITEIGEPNYAQKLLV